MPFSQRFRFLCCLLFGKLMTWFKFSVGVGMLTFDETTRESFALAGDVCQFSALVPLSFEPSWIFYESKFTSFADHGANTNAKTSRKLLI